MGAERGLVDVQYEVDGVASVECVWGGDMGRAGRVLWDEGVGCPQTGREEGDTGAGGAVLIKRKSQPLPSMS